MPWLIRQVFLAIQPRPAWRVGALEQRRGVHADLPIEGRGHESAQPVHYAGESAAQHLVIILAPGVARDPREIFGGEFGGVGLRPVVELAYAEDREGGRQQGTGIVP